MVFFNCNSCCEALKKNQVEKHLLRCRQCNVLSCVDCGKDFWGNDYQTHTKCMSENEKYCGKGYVPKVNKGEAKQEQWIEKVQTAIEKSASNPKLKELLVKLKDFPNIPRKKQKFENFIVNSLRIRNTGLIQQVWDLLMAVVEKDKAAQNIHKSAAKSENNETNQNGVKADSDEGAKQNGSTNEVSDGQAETEQNTHKLSKREKKEERSKKANKKEKKDKVVVDDAADEKKGKKRKHSTGDDDVINEVQDSSKAEPKKKKKKKLDAESETIVDDADGNDEPKDEDQENEPAETKKKKTKFNWQAAIVAALESKGEMSLKKLRKKVLSEFAAQDAANYSEDNLRATFDKKVNKISNVKVFKDRVKLK